LRDGGREGGREREMRGTEKPSTSNGLLRIFIYFRNKKKTKKQKTKIYLSL
jgi:hypothetical protein